MVDITFSFEQTLKQTNRSRRQFFLPWLLRLAPRQIYGFAMLAFLVVATGIPGRFCIAGFVIAIPLTRICRRIHWHFAEYRRWRDYFTLDGPRQLTVHLQDESIEIHSKVASGHSASWIRQIHPTGRILMNSSKDFISLWTHDHRFIGCVPRAAIPAEALQFLKQVRSAF
ncbi:MAG: hypothetical protein JWO82_4123 [Akkermansiaceae bacterium]|nr:hypothetical protein [Akkermansiaceae bacterium]